MKTPEEKKRLMQLIITKCERAIYLLDKAYDAHVIEQARRDACTQ